MPPEINPRIVFQRLFGKEDLSLDPETRARHAGYRKSIDTDRLLGKIGNADKRKMDEYL